MSKVRFKLRRAGVRELLRSQEAANVCAEYANVICGRCGEGYEVTTHPGGKTRSNASVMAVTVEARRDNLENNTLEKAIY